MFFLCFVHLKNNILTLAKTDDSKYRRKKRNWIQHFWKLSNKSLTIQHCVCRQYVAHTCPLRRQMFQRQYMLNRFLSPCLSLKHWGFCPWIRRLSYFWKQSKTKINTPHRSEELSNTDTKQTNTGPEICLRQSLQITNMELCVLRYSTDDR